MDETVSNGGPKTPTHMEQESGSPHPSSLEPETPMVITQVISWVVTIISNYGWPCLLLGVLCGVLWSRYAPSVRAWRKKREEMEEAALYHKNPELALQRESALESARLRMQEQYAAASREHAEKQRIREEERNLQKLEAREAQLRGEGGRQLRQQPEVPAAPTTNLPKRRPVFRQEYNPLLGSGPSSGYRPARRGGAAGGG